jgi:hypothetical protein
MKTNKKASSEHAKTAYFTQNKQKKKNKKRPQQNMLNQVMSHTTNQKNKQKGLNRTC